VALASNEKAQVALDRLRQFVKSRGWEMRVWAEPTRGEVWQAVLKEAEALVEPTGDRPKK
jgi:hypothetical protein